MSLDLDALIEALSDPAVYPHGPGAVHVIQTHISVIFIAGDLVYKIKKPVNFGFLDFTTLEKRKFYCHREIELNSRYSEGIYLDVVSIFHGRSGINLNSDGREIDVAVKMKRIPEDRMLINMLRNEVVTSEILDRLADRIADIHSQAPTNVEITRYGSLDVVKHNVGENFNQTEPFIGRTIEPNIYETIQKLSTDFLTHNHELFNERVRAGFIRDCHGDLHVEHVIVLNGIMLFDCIEFNERFRYCDTASDIGFLLMDLDFQGYPAYTDRVIRRYTATSGDAGIPLIVRFYQYYRAFVRGKVIGFTLDEPEVSDAEKETAIQTARDYFALALTYLKSRPEPTLIITCGVSGSGKGYVASRLGERIGTEPIRSDVIRKKMYGVEKTEHRLDNYGEGIYRSSATERTYNALLDQARSHLTKGKSVILDASFSSRDHRMRAVDLAQKYGARFRIIECVSPEDVLQRRVEYRLKEGTDPSDMRVDILERQLEDFEPIEDIDPMYVWRCDSTLDVNDFLVNFVRDWLVSDH